jgi:DNA-binding SARP family transcriptional activator/DNA polymerase III delta prime subunit
MRPARSEIVTAADRLAISLRPAYRYDMTIEGTTVAAAPPGRSAGLRIALLGSPVIDVDGAPLRVDTKKAVALLAYLAMASGPQLRDPLATLLWPEYDQARARAAFRRTLSALGSALRGRWVAADRARVVLDRAGLWVDVSEFNALIETVDDDASGLVDAVRLYRGDFMVGFALRDAPEFDDWQLFHAETYRRRFAGALDRLVELRASTGRLEDAVDLARRRLALDALHEPAHRRLMSLFAEKGERAAALHQYRDCVALLERELGVAPLEETTRLYRDILERRVSAKPTPSQAPPSSAPPGPFPLVGRDAELARALRTFDATGPDGRIVVFSGEPGIGKTRMAHETARAVERRGAPVVAARCHEDERGIPYALMTAALRGALRHRPDALASLPGPARSEAGRLVREIAEVAPSPPAASLDDAAAQVRFLEGLAATLHAAVAPKGILLLDDLQWADHASLDALVYFLRRFEGRDVCVVATWRNELPPDHPLARVIRELIAEGRGTHIPLDRLEQRDIDALVPAADVDDGEGVARRLMEETEGVPFFIVQYLQMLRGSGEWKLPKAAVDVLAQRLASKSEWAQQLLGAAAVIGRSFDFETLRAASGRSPEECVAGIEELMVGGVIEEVAEGPGSPGYDFSHDQIRRYVYDHTSLARRRILHLRVAHSLAKRHVRARTDGTTAAIIAGHFRAAGEEQEAARFYERAAEHARSLFANEEAIENLQASLALRHPQPARLHEALGDLHTLGGDYPAAIASYGRAAALGPDEALGTLEHKIAGVHLRRADWSAAQAHLNAALEDSRLHADLAARARILADRSMVAHRLGNSDAARTIAYEALELAEAAGDEAARAQSHNILGVLITHEGHYEDAIRHLNTSLAAAEASDWGAIAAAYNNLALATRGKGDLEGALRFGEKALEASRRHRDRHREAAIHNNLADTLHAAGREQEAMAHLKRAAGLFAAVGASATPEPEIWKLVEW